MAEQTSVGPISASIFSCGHSTTVVKGNMNSFLATAWLGDVQWITSFYLAPPQRGLLRELGVFIPVGAENVVPAVWALDVTFMALASWVTVIS